MSRYSSSYPFPSSSSILCTFLAIFLTFKPSSATDYQYEACAPKNCGHGPNISFPFHISGVQESYCGYPGFALNCSKDGFPVLELSENNYVIVQDIFYQYRSILVYNSAVSGQSMDGGCVPNMIRNTTLPTGFNYVNVTDLHLFSNCSIPPKDQQLLSKYELKRCKDDVRNNETQLAVYEGDGETTLRSAIEICTMNVVAPVQIYEEETNGGVVSDIVEVLRRGFVMSWTASNCSTCKDSGGRCGFIETSYHFQCFCTDRPHSRSCKPGSRQWKLILAVAMSGVVLVLVLSLAIVCIIWRRKKKLKKGYLPGHLSSHPSLKSDAEGSTFLGIPIFSYSDLELATDRFDPSKEIGDGGFGTVYYGKLEDGREVAVKRLYEHNYKRMEQFMNEIKILTGVRHPNLVSLYGCTSRKSRELLLVYEYVHNGTVADNLHGDRAKEARLTWDLRLRIAIETATALAYLHKSDIVHRDVKTNNILLDRNFRVKVADFGLSRLFPSDVSHVSTAPQGTPGYVDPEYHQCYQLTGKSDVYSFGVVLIELISSMPAVDITRHRHEINLANLAINRIQRCAFDELIDPSLGYEEDDDVKRMTTSVAELAFRCLQTDKDLRPAMGEVLEFLLGIEGGGEGLEKMGSSGGGGNHGKILTSPSPETDDAVLLKGKRDFIMPSPNAVTDAAWVSVSSTTTSSMG